MSSEVYSNYLHDLGILLKEMALKAKAKKQSSLRSEDEAFATGYLAAFHRVISLMQQQAEGFQIPFQDIGLEDIDADEDLI